MSIMRDRWICPGATRHVTVAPIERMVRPLRSTLLCCLSTVAAMAPGHALAQAVPSRQAVLEDAPCSFEVASAYRDRLSCHHLVVPRDYADPREGTFRLAVVRIRAEQPAPGRVPVLLLHGGPGGRGLTFAAGRPRPEFAPGADLVAFDQRGNGQSEPRICEDIPSETLTAIAAPGDLLSTAWRMNEPYMRCRTRFEAAGVSPIHFGTRVTSQDADQLRLALGVDRWDLMAVSYGTVVALDMLAAYPESIGKVVLDSPVRHASAVPSSEYDRPLREVFARCAADAACARAYPSLGADYDAAVATFDASPMLIAAGEDGATPSDIDLNGGDLQFLLRRMMRSPRNIASIPKLVTAAKERDAAALRPLLGDAFGALPEPNALGRPAIMCREVPSFRSVQAPVHAVESFRLLGVCPAWGPPGPPPRLPTSTASPVLMLVGELDPLYDPALVDAVREGLGPRATLARFANRTHGVWSPGCARDIVAAFFDTGALPDNACSQADPEIAFAPPAH